MIHRKWFLEDVTHKQRWPFHGINKVRQIGYEPKGSLIPLEILVYVMSNNAQFEYRSIQLSIGFLKVR